MGDIPFTEMYSFPKYIEYCSYYLVYKICSKCVPIIDAHVDFGNHLESERLKIKH